METEPIKPANNLDDTLETTAASADTARPASDPAAPEPGTATPPPGEGPPDALEKLKAETAKAREHWDRLLRVTADFDNYKKRMARERQEASRYAYAPLLQQLLPVLDHFEMALAAAHSNETGSLQSFHDGMTMIYQQLRGALTDAGLEEINADGQSFDHNWHEAVSQQATNDVPEGQVLQQLRKGYKFRDRLLRPASVVVAKPPAGEPTAAAPAQS